MYRRLLGLILVLIAVQGYAQVAPPVPGPARPVAWWRAQPGFTGGTTVQDVMPAANHGTWVSMGAFGATGGWNPSTRRGGYMMWDFNSSAGYIDMGSRPSLNNLPQKTILAWIFMRYYGGGYEGRIVDKQGSGTGWVFNVNADVSGRLAFRQD